MMKDIVSIITVRRTSTLTGIGTLHVRIRKRLSTGTYTISAYKRLGYLDGSFEIEGRRLYIRKEIKRERVHRVIGALRKLKVPVFPVHDMGCDGGFTEIICGGYEGFTHLRWWSMPPRSWAELDDIVYDIVSYSGIRKKLEDACGTG